MYDGKSFKFGSLEEVLALSVLNNNRQIELTKPVFSVVDPEQAQKLLKSYRSLIFPEYKYDDLRYVKKAKEIFRKMRNVNLFVKPVHANRKRQMSL